MEKIIRISVDKKCVEETLYAAMVSESERLKNTFSRSERNEIRDFIVQCFRLLEAALQENERQGTYPEDMPRLM